MSSAQFELTFQMWKCSVTPPLVIVANIHQLRSLNFPGVTPPWSWWLCLGINLFSAPTDWQQSLGLWCSPKWFPFPRGRQWPRVLAFPFEIESPEFSGAPDEVVTACSQSCGILFGRRQEAATPRWSSGTGAGLLVGLGLLKCKLLQECELCIAQYSSSVVSAWVNLVGLFEKSFRRGQYSLKKK